MSYRTMCATVCALVAAAIGCAGSSAPATQPAPATYKPDLNDPKAVAIADAAIAAAGGAQAWANVEQLQWKLVVVVDGEKRGVYEHAWDRANGRHRFDMYDVSSLAEAEKLNEPSKVVVYTTAYKLFDQGRGFSEVNGKEVSSADQKRMTDQAYERWQLDNYLVSFVFKMRDPGVYLAYDGNTTEHCPTECDVIKVTFDPSVGEDSYFIRIDRASKLPVVLEMKEQGAAGVIAYKIAEWTDVGGIKLPATLQNVNYSGGELWTFSNYSVTEPDDRLFIPQVR